MTTIALAGLAETSMWYGSMITIGLMILIAVFCAISIYRKGKISLGITLVLLTLFIYFIRPWLFFEAMDPVIDMGDGKSFEDPDIIYWNKKFLQLGWTCLAFAIIIVPALGYSILKIIKNPNQRVDLTR